MAPENTEPVFPRPLPALRGLRIAFCTAFVVLATNGCHGPDERLAEMSERHNRQQAEQNHDMTEMTRSAAENHRKIIESIEQSRAELARVQEEIGSERRKLDKERQAIAQARYRDSLLAPTISTVGLLLAVLVPILVLSRAIHNAPPSDFADLDCVTIHEILLSDQTDRPTLPVRDRKSAESLPASPDRPSELPF